MNCKFNIGDYVIVVNSSPRYEIASVGSYGKIRAIVPMGADFRCEIMFDYAQVDGKENTENPVWKKYSMPVLASDLELYYAYKKYLKLQGIYGNNKI